MSKKLDFKNAQWKALRMNLLLKISADNLSETSLYSPDGGLHSRKNGERSYLFEDQIHVIQVVSQRWALLIEFFIPLAIAQKHKFQSSTTVLD
jgi:hypothetical protein